MSNDNRSLLRGITGAGQEYFQLKADYFKLQGIEKGAGVAATSITSIIMGVLALLTYFWSMFAVVFYLSEKVFYGSTFKAAFAVFLGHLFLLIFLFLFKGIIQRLIIDKITVSSLNKFKKF